MKQIVRRVIDRKGRVLIAEVPAPRCGPSEVLIRTAYTLISSGTETATLRKTPLGLVRQTLSDPWTREAVRQTLETGGLRRTVGRVLDELKLFRLLGYSGSGEVMATGEEVTGFRPGDRVAFAARGHAEVVAASRNLTVPVPDGLPLREAAFVTVGGIAVQGVRRAEVELGHRIAVIGLGLVGQLVAQVARAAGGRVIGIDPQRGRLELGKDLGLEHALAPGDTDPVRAVRALTGGRGADRVIICAASEDRAIANQAMKMARAQGRVVAVGIVRMDLERMPFFRNELDFAFSRAYGPGSYDPAYESGAVDYPFGYVRWTEGRNLEEFLRLLSSGAVRVGPLIDSERPAEEAQAAFKRVEEGGTRGVAALLRFGGARGPEPEPVVRFHLRPSPDAAPIRVGIIGCGRFTRGVRLPDLKRIPGLAVHAIASREGVTAAAAARRYRSSYCTTDYRRILDDPEVNAVIIATRHDLHASMAREALERGKAVFVEKPLALSLEDLEAVIEAARASGAPLQVGHNRRFARSFRTLRKALPLAPKIIEYRVAIPPVPPDHWTLDPVQGGGRLLGEGTHFLDTMAGLSGSLPLEVSASAPRMQGDPALSTSFQVSIRYSNGDLGVLIYSALGGPSRPRERIRVDCAGQSYELRDFGGFWIGGHRVLGVRRGLGHFEELKAFASLLRPEGRGPDPAVEAADRLQEADSSTRTALLAREALRSGVSLALLDLSPAAARTALAAAP